MDLADAKLLASEIVKDAEKVEFYGNKLSAPGERMLNLAQCFIRLNEPMCCQKEQQCEVCPMRRWATGWLGPIVKAEVEVPRPVIPGRGGMAITLNGHHYESIAAASRKLGVHKSVINRMLRDSR